MNTSLKPGERVIAGLLLIFFIVLPLILILALWPDSIKQNTYWYTNKAFHVTLIKSSVNDASINTGTVPNETAKPSLNSHSNTSNDTSSTSDTQVRNPADTSKVDKPKKSDAVDKGSKKHSSSSNSPPCVSKIHLNILILLLVALTGFLGNMIYVARSFTAFTGMKTFDNSWLLWYFIKPFIGAGLAVIVYLAFNDMPEATTQVINLHRIVLIAALTGLFTDIAILKLKDVFEVLIKPTSDTVVNKSKEIKINVAGITPSKIDVNATNSILIPGEELDSKKLDVKINNVTVKDTQVTPDAIKFDYTVSAADKNATSFLLVISDPEGKVLGKKTL